MNLERLNELIEESGVKYVSLANKMGITYTSLRNKLDGRQLFKLHELLTLCRACGISGQELLEVLNYDSI